MIRFIARSFGRRSSLRPSRWRLLYRSYKTFLFLCTVLSIIVLFFHSITVFELNYSKSSPLNTIVSLTTTPERFHYELPFAIHSLLLQTFSPTEIRVYLSPTSAIKKFKNLTLTHLKLSVQRLDSSKSVSRLFDKLVRVRFVDEDYGPATKFIPIIREFYRKPVAIVICDDDNYYHPLTLITLYKYSKKLPNSIIGLRGWRVREDLIWGVGGKYEMAYHIVESFYITDIYRVGVVTANSAYLIRPSFFDSKIYVNFSQIPSDIRHVDDIWLNGQAAQRNISRYVVPSCCSHIEVTRTHALEEYLARNKMSRLSANNNALRWFGQFWEKNLWYKYSGINGPKYRRLWILVYREWINFIFQLRFFLYFGFL